MDFQIKDGIFFYRGNKIADLREVLLEQHDRIDFAEAIMYVGSNDPEEAAYNEGYEDGRKVGYEEGYDDAKDYYSE